MATSHSISLQTFIYRTLSIRLVVMTVAIGLVTAAAVYVVEGRKLRSLVTEETRTEMLLLTARTLQISRENKKEPFVSFRQALDERLSVHLRRENGQFVYAGFHSKKTRDIEERLDSHYALIDQVMEFVHSHSRLQSETDDFAETIKLGKAMHVHIVMPIEDLSHQKVGYVQAIFAPSKKTLTTIQKNLERSIILTILIVLATSALLYPVILHLVRKLVNFSRNLLEANLESLSILASAIAKRDSDTDVHNFRVTLYSVRLAEALKLTDSEIQTLIKGAFLHDVGKIGVRDNILLKPGRLDEEEFSLMKTHVQHGLDIVSGSMWLTDAMQVVGSHHEKYDGSGYPQGRAGEDIPLLARIFAIVDVFDALTSKRPYKESLSYEESMAMLEKGRANHFDPHIFDAFSSISGDLYRLCAGRDDQGLRDELRAVIARYFSEGEIPAY